ncbi:MAG: aldehyde ferredoxin oxidoreductase C-terminal domain-containing protein [Myxococcota bacterium]
MSGDAGWLGKILKIDLARKTHKIIEPNLDLYVNYLGGRGLAGYFAGQDPDFCNSQKSPPLFIFAGPLAGTAVQGSASTIFFSRSPLTGGISFSSFQGNFALDLKKLGFDGLIISGVAPALCGLRIAPGGFEQEIDQDLAEKTANQLIREHNLGSSSLLVGKSAHLGIKFAGVISGKLQISGSGGLGNLMAEKKLSFIKLEAASETAQIAKQKPNPEIERTIAASPFLAGKFGLKHYGNGVIFDLAAHYDLLPTANFTGSKSPEASQVNSITLFRQFYAKSKSCPHCSLDCRKITEKGQVFPDYSAMAAFSTQINHHDPQLVMTAFNFCLQRGLEPLNAAAAVATWTEIEGKKLAQLEVLDLLKEIAENKDRGRALKAGVEVYAQHRGNPEAAMTMNNQAIFPINPRGAWGVGLGYLTATGTEAFFNSFAFGPEILGKPVLVDRLSFEGKARLVKAGEDKGAASTSLALCPLLATTVPLSFYAKILSELTDHTCTGNSLLQSGEKIIDNERRLNHKLKVKPVRLPPRLFDKKNFTWKKMNKSLDIYNKLRR